MTPNVKTMTFVIDPNELDDKSLDDLEDDLSELNTEGWHIAATFPTGLIILEREDVHVEVYTGAGTHRKRPRGKVKDVDLVLTKSPIQEQRK